LKRTRKTCARGVKVTHGWQRLGDSFALGAAFCLFAEVIFYNRLITRLNSANRLNGGLPGPRRTPFQAFREYRQIYEKNDLPRICIFWLMGFMILLTASFISGPF
jgi:hypothetical protein